MTVKICIAFAIFSNVMASVLLKFASAYIPEKISIINFKGVLLVGGALSFYAISFFLYAFILRNLPISKAYLYITFGSQAVLLFVGSYIFAEKHDPVVWVGIFIVLFGITLVGIGGGK